MILLSTLALPVGGGCTRRNKVPVQRTAIYCLQLLGGLLPCPEDRDAVIHTQGAWPNHPDRAHNTSCSYEQHGMRTGQLRELVTCIAACTLCKGYQRLTQLLLLCRHPKTFHEHYARVEAWFVLYESLVVSFCLRAAPAAELEHPSWKLPTRALLLQMG